MKVSLVVTILNEEKTILRFLKSVWRQTVKPEELIIVDGGSTDKTIDLIKNFEKNFSSKEKIKIKLLICVGANRSVGRNIGIREAKNEIIAVTDAGCILDRKWLNRITQPFLNKEVNVVAGFYLPKTRTIFQKCLAPYFCVMKETIEKKSKLKNFEFLPSSRSLAFRKKVWSEAGGYPEKMNYCEDLVFDQRIKKAGYKLNFIKEAVVFWPQRKNLSEAFRQFFNYAVGDGQVLFSDEQTHSLKIFLIFFRYLVFIFLFVWGFIFRESWSFLYILFLFYLFWSFYKNFKFVKDVQAVFWLPTIQIVSDFAIMAGVIKGIFLKEKVDKIKE